MMTSKIDLMQSENLLDLTTNIVSAYLTKNNVGQEEIPNLIKKVYDELSAVAKEDRRRDLIPAVPVEDSVTDDYIICLEDGKKLKMIKRHLRAVYNMSVDEYRQRWGLPTDYPSVAPNYAKKRSSLAKTIGLGLNGRRRKAS